LFLPGSCPPSLLLTCKLFSCRIVIFHSVSLFKDRVSRYADLGSVSFVSPAL
jgi:hypothetical protein